jgi:hypothetical protein
MVKRLLLSWWLFSALLIPLFILFSFKFLLQLPVSFILGAKVFKVYAFLIMVFLFIKGTYAIFQKRFFHGGIILLILSFVLYYTISYELRFKARVFVPEGSGIEGYLEMEKGALAKIPQIPLILKKIEGNRCVILIGSQEYTLGAGQEVSWNGYRIMFNNIQRALLIQLKDAKRAILDEAYFNLVSKEKRDYFMFPLLPHRFFISHVEPIKEYWKLEGNKWKKVKEDRVIAGEKKFHLLIMRGKLTVFEQDIEEDEDIAFEGYYINIKTGQPVAVFQIKK